MIYNLTPHESTINGVTLPRTPSGVLGSPSIDGTFLVARIEMESVPVAFNNAIADFMSETGVFGVQSHAKGDAYLALVDSVGNTHWTGSMPVEDEDVAFFVSSFVVEWAQENGRSDFFTGLNAVRDESGKITGAIGIKATAKKG